ncbi:hypothetical protein F5Y18DRAFT_424314 [Xylariaceae sp. FL1019]|nr:hypothetical protein F5Y18DRAFT_424314 [Xylariaceae sp. FL1019]
MKSFHQFQRFPAEIQLMIWEEFLEAEFAQRPIIVMDYAYRALATLKLKESPLHRVSTQSREIAKKFYPWTVPVCDYKRTGFHPLHPQRGNMKLNPKRDVFCFGFAAAYSAWNIEERYYSEPFRWHTKPQIKVVLEMDRDLVHRVQGMSEDAYNEYTKNDGRHREFKGVRRSFWFREDARGERYRDRGEYQRILDVIHTSATDYLRKYKDRIAVMEKTADTEGGNEETGESREVEEKWKNVVHYGDLTDKQIAEFLTKGMV